MAPRVSILMATCNRARMIPRAIESARAQTFPDWELIISDDGSTDDTPAVVETWRKKEPRITYVRSEMNQGISRNYNRGLRIARGEYVAMMDDDDPWCDPKKLEKQVDFLDKNPDHVGCGGGMIVTDMSGKELYRYLKPRTHEEIRKRMLFGNPIANSTALYRRAAGEAVGLHDESLPSSGDRDFWMKMGLRGKLYNFPEYFAYYTVSGGNISLAKIRLHLRMSLKVMRRYKGKYPYYLPALVLNWTQYLYSFLPGPLRRAVHFELAKLKRRLVG